MYKRALFVLPKAAGLALLVTLMPRPAGAVSPETIKRADLEASIRVQKILNPNGPDFGVQLARFPSKQKEFTAAEVQLILQPTTESEVEQEPVTKDRTGWKPRGAITMDAARDYFALKARTNPQLKNREQALETVFGKHPWYLPSELRYVEAKGAVRPKVAVAWPRDEPPGQVEKRLRELPRPWYADFQAPRIRRDWRDVLVVEDPSQPESAREKLSDLVGATFAYTHDGKASSDTWSAVGALILPWQFDAGAAHESPLSLVSLAPSVSMRRITTNGDPAVEADSLIYRLGAYFDFVFDTPDPTGVELRGAGVLVSDTGHRAELWGYELELEPRWQNDLLPIGYKHVLISKAPEKPDGTDDVELEYELRAWARLEGGDVQNAGKTWLPAVQSFARAGGAVQLQVNAPYFLAGTSLTVLYSYLADIEGETEHDSYFRSTLSFNLIKPNAFGHKVALNLEYQQGGLDFTQEEVETFTVGFGVLF